MDYNKASQVSLYLAKNECCGCSACSAICPVHAISMDLDTEGFFYPRINEELCVQCHCCEVICQFKRAATEQTATVRVFAARTRDSEILRHSSSGGMFSALSDAILSEGNAVACCSYNYTSHDMKYSLILSTDERNAARGSKYVSACTDGIFKKCLSWLNDNSQKKLMFIGVGCVADGFRAFCESNHVRERVIIVDLICHGNASIRVWKDYIQNIEEEQKDHVRSVDFKDKRYGWLYPKALVRTRRKEISIEPYTQLFYSQYILRPSCYTCPYTRIKRSTDLTIGDYWNINKTHPEFYDKMGNSLVLIHTVVGQELFDMISKNLAYVETRIEDCIQPRLVSPASCPPQRDKFWADYNKHGLSYVMKIYGNSLYKKMLLLSKRLYHKFITTM